MLIAGLYALVAGKLQISSGSARLEGTAARVAGVILLLPLPLSFGAGALIGMIWVMQGKNVAELKTNQGLLVGTEALIVLGCLVTAIFVGSALQKRQQPSAPPLDPNLPSGAPDPALFPFRPSDPQSNPPPNPPPSPPNYPGDQYRQ
jgi:hypothetical protein